MGTKVPFHLPVRSEQPPECEIITIMIFNTASRLRKYESGFPESLYDFSCKNGKQYRTNLFRHPEWTGDLGGKKFRGGAKGMAVAEWRSPGAEHPRQALGRSFLSGFLRQAQRSD
jgi:hypothetical protein